MLFPQSLLLMFACLAKSAQGKMFSLFNALITDQSFQVRSATASSTDVTGSSQTSTTTRRLGEIIATALGLEKAESSTTKSLASSVNTVPSSASMTVAKFTKSSTNFHEAACTDQWLAYFSSESSSLDAANTLVTSLFPTPVVETVNVYVASPAVTPYTTLVSLFVLCNNLSR